MKIPGFVLLTILLINQNEVNAQDIAQVCTLCNGHGTQECALCEGKGKWKAEVDGKKKKVDCPACKGSEQQPCWLCNGTGKAAEVIQPATSTSHPDGYSWLWCGTCKHHGVVKCTRCGGLGDVYASNGDASTCGLCDGKRYVLCSYCNGTCGWYTERLRCDVCEGNGSVTCSQCNGQGWLPPERVDKAFAEVCKPCKGFGLVPHKDCGGRGCKHCKNGKVVCRPCDGHGAVIISPEPKYVNCKSCNHKGIQRCTACTGKGYRNITAEGIVR